MWPTRRGAWRSRAGGVYLPPEANIERQGSPSLSPARWMYPEEFNRPLQMLGETMVKQTFSTGHPTVRPREDCGKKWLE